MPVFFHCPCGGFQVEHEGIEGRLTYRSQPKRMEKRFSHDDDTVAVSFVKRLKRTAREYRPLLERNKFVAFYYPKGYVERPNAQGLHVQETFHQFWGRGVWGLGRVAHTQRHDEFCAWADGTVHARNQF